jgi:hypothetical protein
MSVLQPWHLPVPCNCSRVVVLPTLHSQAKWSSRSAMVTEWERNGGKSIMAPSLVLLLRKLGRYRSQFRCRTSSEVDHEELGQLLSPFCRCKTLSWAFRLTVEQSHNLLPRLVGSIQFLVGPLSHYRPALRAIWPASQMIAAVMNRARPESDMPNARFASCAVSGQAAIPEQKANHPFVNGQGPFSMSNITPPPPARTAHAQARMKPNVANRGLFCAVVGPVTSF